MEQTSKKRTKSNISLILRIFVAAAACFFIFRDLDFEELIFSFRSLHLWIILLAILVKFFAEMVLATRWWILLRTLGIIIPLKTTIRLHFHGLFFSSFLPSSMGGDFVRAWYVTRHTHKRLQSALSVFVDRFTGLASTLGISIVTYFLFLRGSGVLKTKKTASLLDRLEDYQSEIIIGFGLLITVVIVLAAIPQSRALLKNLVIHAWHYGKKIIRQLQEVISIYFRKLWLGPMAVGLTVFFQCMTFLTFWLIGRDLGVTDQARYYFALFPLIWVVGSLPISIAGIGILEGGVVFLFMTVAGAEKTDAAALALCQRAIFLIGAIPGIWIHLRADYLPKSKDEFFIDE